MPRHDGKRRSPRKSLFCAQPAKRGVALVALAAGAVLAACVELAPKRSDARAGAGHDDVHARDRMVDEQLARRGIADPRVLDAMRAVPRHRFVPEAFALRAYADGPLAIGEDQTISQPYVVAKMTELLELEPRDRVFELGTGSGYQAAVAARLAAEVYSVEIRPALADRAKATFAELGISNVHVRTGDGMAGWPEAAPFDAMIVTAALPSIPPRLLEQLRPGGRAVMPVDRGDGGQDLVVVDKGESGEIVARNVLRVQFVPALTP